MRRALIWLALIAAALPIAGAQAQTKGAKKNAAPAPPTDSSSIQVVSPAAAQFERGMLLFSSQQYAEALNEFTALVRQYPTDARVEESFYRIAECYRLTSHAGDAKSAYAYVVKNYPDGVFVPLAQLRLGELYFQSNEFDKALGPLQAAVDLSKTNPPIRTASQCLLGMCQIKAGQSDLGRATLEAVIAASPNGGAEAAAAAQSLAEDDDKAGRLDASLQNWQRTLSFSESKQVQAAAAAHGGWVAERLNNPKEAEALFETCRRIDVSSQWRAVANSGLLRLYFEQKRYADLLDLKKQEKDRFPSEVNAEVAFDVAHARFEIKQYPEAAAAYDEYLKKFPKDSAVPAAAYERILSRARVDENNLEADAKDYIAMYPDSPFVGQAQYLLANDQMHRQKFADALPLWQALSDHGDKDLPQAEILFQLANTHYELKNWIQAADIYDHFAGEYPDHPSALMARERQALSLQNGGQNEAACVTWEKVQNLAPAKSIERQTALEQLGLLYAEAGKNKEMAVAFGKLLTDFPQTKLRAIASYSVGSWAFTNKDYRKAEPNLLEARKVDTWYLPATERLALLAQAQKNPIKTAGYVADFQHATAAEPKTPPLPAALYFWLGQSFQNVRQYDKAMGYFQEVTNHPQPGQLLNPAWWSLAETQRAGKHFKEAVTSYQIYRQKAANLANATEVILALAQADLGAGDYTPAQSLTEQALLQEPEGKNNAVARSVLGEIYFARGEFAEAAKAFTALSLLYDDPTITPAAMKRAGDAYDKAGDKASAADWRAKLKTKYPRYNSAI